MKTLFIIVLWPLALFSQFENYLSKDFKNFKVDSEIQKSSQPLDPLEYYKIENDQFEKVLTIKKFAEQNSLQKFIGTKIFQKNKDQGIYELISINKEGYLDSITKCHSNTKEKIQENENNTFLANLINSLDGFLKYNVTYNCMTINKSICKALKKNNEDSEKFKLLIRDTEEVARKNAQYMNILGIAKPYMNYPYPIISDFKTSSFNRRSLASDLEKENLISKYKISEMKRICKRTNYHSFKPDQTFFYQMETSSMKQY